MVCTTASHRVQGRVQSVTPVELVPGDIVLIANGDKVPADLRLIELTTASVSVDESSLTGECIPVEKVRRLER